MDSNYVNIIKTENERLSGIINDKTNKEDVVRVAMTKQNELYHLCILFGLDVQNGIIIDKL